MFNGSCFAWSLKKQTSVLLLTAKAEYISAVHAMKSTVWLCTLLNKLGLISGEPIDFHVDNQSAIALINLDDTVNEYLKYIKV